MRPVYSGSLPDGWAERTLASVTTRRRGYSWSKDQETPSEESDTIPVLRIPNVHDRLDTTDMLYLRGVTAADRAAFAVERDWILFVASNGNPDRIGDSVLLESDESMVFASFLQGITTTDRTRVLPAFLYLWLQLDMVHQTFSKTSQRTTGLANFSWSAVKRMPVRYPLELSEQQAIIDLLDSVDRAVNRLRDELNAARRLRTSLLGTLVTRGIPNRHTEFTSGKFGVAPASWDVTPLRKLGNLRSGGTPDRGRPELYAGTVPWVKSGEVSNARIERTAEHVSSDAAEDIGGTYPAGTLLIAMYGEGVTRGKVGLLAMEAAVNQAICTFTSTGRAREEYLFYWLQHHYQRVRSFAGGANQGNLSGYLLGRIPVNVPSPAEQETIVELMTAADSVIAALATKLDYLAPLQGSLRRDLLLGEVRVTALDLA